MGLPPDSVYILEPQPCFWTSQRRWGIAWKLITRLPGFDMCGAGKAQGQQIPPSYLNMAARSLRRKEGFCKQHVLSNMIWNWICLYTIDT
jgi:hypothetical protein